MRKILSAVVVAVVVAVIASATMAPAQAQAQGERFGLGTFTVQNRTFVGLVMRYPTEPQQIGGVVMWVPAGVIPLLVFTIVFFRWAASEPDEWSSADERPERSVSP